MGLIPDDKIAEVRSRADIVEVVGEYVTLRKAGTNHVGLCPFHAEKSPSFNVSPSKQFFHCFGCGKSGDVFSFIMELDGKSFIETCRALATRYGVELPEPPRSAEDRARSEAAQSERQRLLELNLRVAEFYRRELSGPHGEAARAYLETRAISTKTADAFRVGFAPAGWDALVRYLESERVPAELAERAGLIRRRDAAKHIAGAPPNKTSHFDVFVDRVVYPLTSSLGEVIGFGGRILIANPEQPKYKNSPETVLYKKGENLFGLSLAKHSIRKSGRAIVVEGNFDVMSLHDHGWEEVVAPQGTAITREQVQLLSRFAREVILMLDADPAGRAATLKVIHLFVEQKLDARVAQLRSNDGKKVDPDELVKRDPERLKSIIENATDAVEFFFSQVAGSAEDSVPGKVKALDECLPLLRAVAEPTRRDLYVGRLAGLLNLPEPTVRRAMRGGDVATLRQAPAPSPTVTSTEGAAEPVPEPVKPRNLSPVAAAVLGLLGAFPKLVNNVPIPVLDVLGDDELRDILADAVELGELDPQALVGRASPALRPAIARAFLSDAYAGLTEPKKTLDQICQSYLLPDDPRVLIAERQKAVLEGNLELSRQLTARIHAARQPRRG